MLITDLPVELLLDHVLPALTLQSLGRLSQTNKFFALLCSDDTFWRVKLQEDYNFDLNADTARESGWKIIYKGIQKPSVYTWGGSGQGRLGVSLPSKYRGGVPFPVKVDINARVVALVPGGWCFHALDDAGRIHAWGQLNGEGYASGKDGFSDSMKGASRPHRLQVSYPTDPTSKEVVKPVKFTSLSCGRAHLAGLDAQHNAWLFTSWGRPIQLTSHILADKTDPGNSITQVESGWGFVSTLTHGGDVHVIWPGNQTEDFYKQMEEKNEELDEQDDTKAHAIQEGDEHVIPCYSYSLSVPPLTLPPIPDNLPDLTEADPTAKEFEAAIDSSGKVVEATQHDARLKLIRIAAGDNFIVGLTNKGHVLSIDLQGGGEDKPMGMEWIRGQWSSHRRAAWIYHPEFSEVKEVNEVFAAEGSQVAPPTKLKITHISAHFRSFTAYSVSTATIPHASLVLLGNCERDPVTETLGFQQVIYPKLLSQSVISLQFGDYHRAALTSQGKLYTWGQYGDGALGLGDPQDIPLGAPGGFQDQEQLTQARDRRWIKPPDVDEPTEVKFDQGGKKFVVSVAAAGWHTGALVINLDGNDEEEGDVRLHGKGKAPRPDDDSDTYKQWLPQPIGRRMPGDWPHPLPSTGVPHSVELPVEGPSNPDLDDPLAAYEAPPFNPHGTSNRGGPHPLPRPPYTTSGPNPPIVPGPVLQRDGAGGSLPFGARIGFAGRGGLRGNASRLGDVSATLGGTNGTRGPSVPESRQGGATE